MLQGFSIYHSGHMKKLEKGEKGLAGREVSIFTIRLVVHFVPLFVSSDLKRRSQVTIKRLLICLFRLAFFQLGSINLP